MEKLCFQKKLGSFQTKKHKLGKKEISFLNPLFCKKWTQFLLLLGIPKFPKTAQYPLNLVKFWSKHLPNFVYPTLILQNRSHTAVHIYFLNPLPLSQQWIDIHFEVLLFLLS